MLTLVSCAPWEYTGQWCKALDPGQHISYWCSVALWYRMIALGSTGILVLKILVPWTKFSVENCSPQTKIFRKIGPPLEILVLVEVRFLQDSLLVNQLYDVNYCLLEIIIAYNTYVAHRKFASQCGNSMSTVHFLQCLQYHCSFEFHICDLHYVHMCHDTTGCNFHCNVSSCLGDFRHRTVAVTGPWQGE